MEERRMNWMQILVTAIITGVITIISGAILFRIQTREPNLVYTAPDTRPFSGTDRNFAIYNVSISNPGKAGIPDVVGVIQVASATLEDLRITAAPSLTCTHNIISSTLELRIPELNPNETIGVSILATSKSDLPNSPDVSVRGSGITGIEGTSPETKRFSDWFTWALPATLAVYSGLAFVYIARRRGSLFLLVSHKHSDAQNEILAYLCGLHGLMNDVQEYLSKPCDTSYWAEADRFAAIAVANPTADEAEKRKNVLKDLLEYASVASLSVGIIYYDVARIAFAQAKHDEAKENLKKAKQHAGRLIDIRLKLEPHLQELLDSAQTSGDSA
jgi:hypothetical protein